MSNTKTSGQILDDVRSKFSPNTFPYAATPLIISRIFDTYGTSMSVIELVPAHNDYGDFNTSQLDSDYRRLSTLRNKKTGLPVISADVLDRIVKSHNAAKQHQLNIIKTSVYTILKELESLFHQTGRFIWMQKGVIKECSGNDYYAFIRRQINRSKAAELRVSSHVKKGISGNYKKHVAIEGNSINTLEVKYLPPSN